MAEGSMSRKRKMEALAAAHAVPAVVGDLVSRSISAVIGKFQQERPDVDAEVERLDTLLTMVRAAVEAAEGVRIRNWWLRCWLWKLRDAALEGAAVVRSFRQRAADEANRRRRRASTPWWGSGWGWKWEPLLRSGKSLFFQDDGSNWATLRREVARLEEIASGLGDFLKLLDMETRTPPPPPQQLAPAYPENVVLPRLDEYFWRQDGKLEVHLDDDRHSSALSCLDVEWTPSSMRCGSSWPLIRHTSRRQVLSAAGDKQASAGDQLERLGTLLVKVHSAVDGADRFHIASWKLRRWLSRLRDAALDGDKVLRLFRERRASSAGTPWKAAAKRVLVLIGLVNFTRDDDGTDRLRLTLASLESISSSVSDFLQELDMEISVPEPLYSIAQPTAGLLQRRGGAAATDKKLGEPEGTPAAAASSLSTTPDTDRLHGLVIDIRRAVTASDTADVRAKPWLAEWRLRLQAVADRADRVLLASSTAAAPVELASHRVGGEEATVQMRKTAQSLETAAAYLEDFLTLVSFTVTANAPFS